MPLCSVFNLFFDYNLNLSSFRAFILQNMDSAIVLLLSEYYE